jgi:hypothetical protein
MIKGTSDFDIENDRRRNQFHFIEDLRMELHGVQLLMSAARMIMDSCVQLTVFKGITTWSIKTVMPYRTSYMK